MNFNRSIFYLFLNILILVGLICFSSYRFRQQKNVQVKVEFTKNPILLNDSLVNKLLTQKLEARSILNEDSLDLNMLEYQLKTVPELEKVEIYITPKRELVFEFTERKPLFKVKADRLFYSDINGVLFSYKKFDSISFPQFLSSSTGHSLDTTAILIDKLYKDSFLSREIKSIYKRDNQYIIDLKSYNFHVIIGKPTNVKEKIKKLKVFCAYKNSQDSTKKYKKINLSYNNQVVASTQ